MAAANKLSWVGPLCAVVSLLGASSSAYLNSTYATMSDLHKYAKAEDVCRATQNLEKLQIAQATDIERLAGTEKRVDAIQAILLRMDAKIDDVRNYLLTQKEK